MVTLDTKADRAASRASLGGAQVVQGNIDPAILLPDSTPATIEAEVASLLTDLSPGKLIANLGEGLGGKEDQGLVNLFVDEVHRQSEGMLKA